MRWNSFHRGLTRPKASTYTEITFTASFRNCIQTHDISVGAMYVRASLRATRNQHDRLVELCPSRNLFESEQLSRYSDSLQAGRSGDRIAAEATFSSPSQTGPEAHTPSYTMGTGSLSGGKAAGE